MKKKYENMEKINNLKNLSDEEKRISINKILEVDDKDSTADLQIKQIVDDAVLKDSKIAAAKEEAKAEVEKAAK